MNQLKIKNKIYKQILKIYKIHCLETFIIYLHKLNLFYE